MARQPSDHMLVRSEPRISANELAKYMVASETGKIGIIRKAKESVTPPRTRYRDARPVLRAYLSDLKRDPRSVYTARAMFEQRSEDSARSEFIRSDALNSMDVLDSILRMQNQLSGFAFESAPQRQPFLEIAGVKVSVQLDLLLTRTRGSREQIGGALFRMTRPDEDETEAAAAKRQDMGAYAATLVHMQVSENLAGNRDPYYRLCMSIDVQAEDVHIAPRTYVQRASNLTNACWFISSMWGKV